MTSSIPRPPAHYVSRYRSPTPTGIASPVARPKTPDELALEVDRLVKEHMESGQFPILGYLEENCVHQIVRKNRSPDLIRQIAAKFPVTWENTSTHPFNKPDKSDQKTTPFVLATAMGKSELALALLEGGASKLAKDVWGRTALHYSVMHGDEALTAQLLADEGPYRTEDKSGFRPLNYLVVPDRCKEALKSYNREFKPINKEPIRVLFEKRMREDKCRKH